MALNRIAPYMPDAALLREPSTQLALCFVLILCVYGFLFAHSHYLSSATSANGSGKTASAQKDSVVMTYLKFAWNCFFKPHQKGGSRNQQDALESFYRAQANIYDATRARLLRGREDMLGLVAAQLKHRIELGSLPARPTWIDFGGGTGYNIEAMGAFVDVPNFFREVYLVDLSPSLCNVARDRFARLGWNNVKVVCQDARHFRLEEHRKGNDNALTARALRLPSRADASPKDIVSTADVLTMSYSLSMIPEYYSVVDSITSLLQPNGVIGVADFYVQSEVDYQARNYTGGELDRHCMWISRVFWRTWFEADRVSLEAARRDYLEYKFGTILSFNSRCHMFGLRIPYYVWVGCAKDSGTSQLRLAELNAAATESPFLSALDLRSRAVENAQRTSAIEIRSKAYESAIINLQASLPLPSSWYQAHHWRIYYDETLQKHRQFKDEYIYAFNWEDARVDVRLLKIQEDDVILAITSAGDNILQYALEKPRRIHAVDLNPSQNNLLELKMAAITALDYQDFWKMFGEGKHENFRELLNTKLSPHLSSSTFQYWRHHGPKAFSGSGFYFTGCSRHALNLVQWLFKLVNIKAEVEKLCSAGTLNEQREVWHRSVRRVLLSRLLAWTVVSNKTWLWKALGVPEAQRQMIEQDYSTQVEPLEKTAIGFESAKEAEHDLAADAPTPRPSAAPAGRYYGTGRAIWEYAINTLDPVVENTLLSSSNHYYLLCLLGHYTRRCHPDYLSPKAHQRLSKPGSFDGLRIHTDELGEVVERMSPGTLTVAVVMDSMDWFKPGDGAADKQVLQLKRALKPGGRVLLRSAGLRPWYIDVFDKLGFACRRVACRVPGTCIDRVNMYASTWLCVRLADNGVAPGGNISTSPLATPAMTPAMETAPYTPSRALRATSVGGGLAPLSIGEASLT